MPHFRTDKLNLFSLHSKIMSSNVKCQDCDARIATLMEHLEMDDYSSENAKELVKLLFMKNKALVTENEQLKTALEVLKVKLSKVKLSKINETDKELDDKIKEQIKKQVKEQVKEQLNEKLEDVHQDIEDLRFTTKELDKQVDKMAGKLSLGAALISESKTIMQIMDCVQNSQGRIQCNKLGKTFIDFNEFNMELMLMGNNGRLQNEFPELLNISALRESLSPLSSESSNHSKSKVPQSSSKTSKLKALPAPAPASKHSKIKVLQSSKTSKLKALPAPASASKHSKD